MINETKDLNNKINGKDQMIFDLQNEIETLKHGLIEKTRELLSAKQCMTGRLDEVVRQNN